MKLHLYAMAVLAASMLGSVEAIRIAEGEEKKEQTIELAPGSNHCVKLAQGDAEPEFCLGGALLANGCDCEDKRPLAEQVGEAIERSEKRCEACKPQGTPSAPPA